ncbi:MAG: NfeD family protein [Planctomycetota bacterium]
MPAPYAIGLIVLFYALVILEFLIPSGGVLGIGAAIAAVTAILVAFTHSLTMGLWFLLILLVSTPALLGMLVRLWPRTKLGRQMLNALPGSPAGGESPDRPRTRSGVPLADLVGRIGVARSDLLPSGEVTIDDCHVNAVSLGQPIDKGSLVKVLRVTGRSLQVMVSESGERDPGGGVSVDPNAVPLEQPADNDANASASRNVSGRGLLDEIDLDDMEVSDSSETASVMEETDDR